jgi:phosphoribosylformimino-5-aminoimidazole carboxamide ribotide isomerase
MRIIPVIDLRAGEAVHGIGGDRARYEPVESALISTHGDVLALAQAYASELETSEMYVADLDAIVGGAVQLAMHQRLSRIARTWIDAGVRSEEDACALIDAGADRVVVGLETLPSFELLHAMVRRLGADRVAFSLDLHGDVPLASTDAFRAMSPRELARRAVDAGAETVIVLDLARVGKEGGADETLMRELRAALPGMDLIAGGGVRGREDLDRLAAAGANGALVATAVHRGSIGRELTRESTPESTR